MSGVKKFTELMFWQRSRDLSKEIFFLTKEKPFASDRRLVVQINDSSESTMANIAEGFGRGTQGEFVQFLGYSMGSLLETQSHLVAAYDREYIDADTYRRLFNEGTSVRKMMIAFMKSMTKHGSGVKHIRPPYKSWSSEVWEMYEKFTGEKRPELFQEDKKT
jgi:four helix bundle protein